MIVKMGISIQIIFIQFKKILEPTHGIIIYQEQVMQIAQTLAGFSVGQADILRKLWEKEKSRTRETKGKFCKWCIEKWNKKRFSQLYIY